MGLGIWRASLRGTMGIVVLLACGLAAFRTNDFVWVQLWATAVLSALVAATLHARLAPEGRGRASAGFALAGWAYLALSLGPWAVDAVRPWLITTRLLDEAYLRWYRPPKLDIESLGSLFDPKMTTRALGSNVMYEYSRFVVLGHLVFAVLAGWVGGLLAASFRPRPGGEGA